MYARRACRLGRGERLRDSRAGRGGSPLRQPRLLGGAVGAASSAPYVVKAHGSELEYSTRERGAVGVGSRGARGRRGDRRRSEHIRTVVREGLWDGGSGPRSHPASTWPWRPAPKAEGLAELVVESYSSMRRAWNANERLRRGTRCACCRFSPETGRPSSTTASSSKTRASRSCSRRCAVWTRAVIVGFGDYRAEPEAAAVISTSSS